MMRPDVARRIAELERRASDDDRRIREIKARVAMLRERHRSVRVIVK